MGRIRKIKDIVDWGLCIGCGACSYYCDKDAVEMKNVEHTGIRPFFNTKECANCEGCLHICPGYSLESHPGFEIKHGIKKKSMLIGPTVAVWEGFATEKKIRFAASSGGAVSGLALYCIEKMDMPLVLHVGSDPDRPWENITIVSKNKKQLVKNAGSRYQTSSICESLDIIENSTRPCVFIGRPCDAAAVNKLRKARPALDKKLGLVLSFFCAGTPSTKATTDLLQKLNIKNAQVADLRYRGNGWPGGFTVSTTEGKQSYLTYDESWSFLTKYRPFRCQVCPDGLGEFADISCGDAWHKYQETDKGPGKGDGRSLVLARNEYGADIVQQAVKAGYLSLEESCPGDVIKAQGLVRRRKVIWGRYFAMKMLLVPTTKLNGFYLFKNWLQLPFIEKVNSLFGTLRRILVRGLWHRRPLQ